MDVARPPILKIAGFNYRLNPGDATEESQRAENNLNVDALEDTLNDELLEQEGDVDKRIRDSGDGYTANIDIPSQLFRFIIGTKGDTKRKIEYDSHCRITVPKFGHEGSITVKGSSKRHVDSAITRIETLAERGRTKMSFTHFVCIPFNHVNIQSKFATWQTEVLDKLGTDPGIDKSLFQNPSKLHITICTLTLLDDREIEKACRVLHDCRPELLSILEGGCTLQMEGLNYMNDDPSAIDVLYAKVKTKGPRDKLQKVVDLVLSKFSQAGMVARNQDRAQVKVHVTVMNTLFRKDPKTSSSDQNTNKKQRDLFNATSILKEFGGYKFGEVEFPGLHISQRYSTGCDGFYTAICTLFQTADLCS